MLVKYTYVNRVVEKELDDSAERDYGIRVNNRRPIKVEIVIGLNKDPSKEFIKSTHLAMDIKNNKRIKINNILIEEYIWLNGSQGLSLK